MAELFKSLHRLFGKISHPEKPAAAPRVSLGVLGKHPSFDDHFSEFAADAARLADVLNILYDKGIKGYIDGGEWEHLPPASRLSGFDHVFLWRIGPDEHVIGRLSPSVDSVGRASFPFIMCAECADLPLAIVLGDVLPMLEVVEQRCRGAKSRAAIRETVQSSQAELLVVLAGKPVSGQSPAPDTVAALQKLIAGSPAIVEDHTPLLRILYRLDREASAYFPRQAGWTKTRIASVQPAHLRVPLWADSPADAFDRWESFLMSLFGQTTQLLLLLRRDRQWMDVVVGQMEPQHAFFLRTAGEALTTDIPYEMDAEFVAAASKKIAAAVAAAPGTDGQIPIPPELPLPTDSND